MRLGLGVSAAGIGFGSGLGTAVAAAYTANGVFFDGTNDYLTRGAGLDGAADNKTATVSLWIRMNQDGTETRYFASQAVGAFFVLCRRNLTTNVINFQFVQPSGAAVVWDGVTTTTLTVADGWKHILYSVNTATNARSFWISDVQETMASETYNTNTTIDWTIPEWAVGAAPIGITKHNGDLADLYVASEFIDFTVEANRRKFISAAGKPVNLGSDGSTPTGTAPLMFFSGSTVAWHTNKGSGGGFTANGALTDSTTSPSA